MIYILIMFLSITISVIIKIVKKREPIDLIIFNLIVFIILMFSGSIIHLGFSNHQLVEKDKSNIKSLKLENSIRGSFFLGTGEIKGKNYYYVFKELSKNRYILSKYNAETCIIVETDKVNPQILKIDKVTQFSWFTLPSSELSHYEIRIPKGSIIQQYNPNK